MIICPKWEIKSEKKLKKNSNQIYYKGTVQQLAAQGSLKRCKSSTSSTYKQVLTARAITLETPSQWSRYSEISFISSHVTPTGLYACLTSPIRTRFHTLFATESNMTWQCWLMKDILIQLNNKEKESKFVKEDQKTQATVRKIYWLRETLICVATTFLIKISLPTLRVSFSRKTQDYYKVTFLASKLMITKKLGGSLLLSKIASKSTNRVKR